MSVPRACGRGGSSYSQIGGDGEEALESTIESVGGGEFEVAALAVLQEEQC